MYRKIEEKFIVNEIIVPDKTLIIFAKDFFSGLLLGGGSMSHCKESLIKLIEQATEKTVAR